MKTYIIDRTEKEHELLELHSPVIPRQDESITVESKDYTVKEINYWYESGILFAVRVWVEANG